MNRSLLHSTCILAALAATGCGGRVDDSLMPLEKGRVWTYSVKTGFNSYVEPVKVVRELSVANTKGYELAGALGTSRLAWTDQGLMAEKINGAQFIPPMPLLQSRDNDRPATWSGKILLAERATRASATQQQTADDEVELGGRKVHTTKSVIRIKMPKGFDLELISWFQPGVGIVQQEQRTDNSLLVRLILIEK